MATTGQAIHLQADLVVPAKSVAELREICPRGCRSKLRSRWNTTDICNNLVGRRSRKDRMEGFDHPCRFAASSLCFLRERVPDLVRRLAVVRLFWLQVQPQEICNPILVNLPSH